MAEATLTVLFAQRFGSLDRIVSLLRRRGFPIDGITVERTHQPDEGRMTLVLQDSGAVEQVSRHLRKLPDVLAVQEAGDEDAVQREYALARVHCVPQQRAEVMALLTAFEARAVSVTSDCLVLEAAGTSRQLDALFTELSPYGIEESARTSPMAVRRAPTEARQTA